jgi:ribosomal protein S18 acetylase RimI-like enzyme
MEELDKVTSAEKEPRFRIELPQIGDELAIGPMHLRSWKESYINSASGLTEESVDELVGHIATETDFRKNTLNEALTKPDQVFYRVIKNDRDEIVGFFHCTKSETANEIEGIYLLDEAKGSGVGTQLIEEFLAWADKDKPSHLEVFSFNEAAISFYKKFGFTVVDGSVKLYKEKLPFMEMVREAEEKSSNIIQTSFGILHAMSEKIPVPENKGESIPSEEEILSVFEKLVEGKEFVEIRKKEDEKGIYLWEIKLQESSADGGTVEYSYGREGSYPENKSLETAVHVAFFDDEGYPVGGHSVAKYIKGEWVRT